jgi:PAS domain S-box-containing protein
VRVVGQLVSRLVAATFFSGDPRMVWLVTEAARLWDVHGPMPELVAPLAQASFATIIAAGDYRTGHAVVRWAVAESAARGYRSAHAQALLLYALSASPWFEPPQDTLRYFREAREGLIRAGDLWDVGFTYFSSMYGALGHAATLSEAEAEADSGILLTRRTGDGLSSGTLVASRQVVRALQGRTQAFGSLDDAEFDAEAHVAGLGANVTAAANTHVGSALVAAIFADHDALERHSAALMPLLPFVEATPVTANARLVRGLALAYRVRSGAGTAGSDPSAELRDELDACVAWMERRAEECPANFAADCDLLRAERAWAFGDADGAAEWFDRACEAHRHGEIPGHEALTVERYARMQLARGLGFGGRTLLRQARNLYADWGADGKVAQLDEEFPFLQDEAVGPARQGSTSTRRPSTVLSGTSIDLVAILRAFQILSTETNPARLQDWVSEVLALLTGASQVRLVLRDPDTGGWSLPGGGGGGGGEGEVGMVPLVEAGAAGSVPMSVFRYVERTGETLLVDDALTDVRFAGDPYFGGVSQCSVLGVPIVARGGPRAVLLLENRLARGAFNARRTDAVALIAGELGICLDNILADRFRSLVQRSAELTLVCDRSAEVLYASAACVDLLGREERLVVGMRPGDLFVVEDREAVTRQLDQMVPGEAALLTVRLAHVDGQPRWVEGALTDLTGDPAVGGVMVRLRDVTERHRLETELRHAQKLESVGQLASGIAHEINTPMQFITANLHFLTDAFAELSAPGAGAGAALGAGGAGGADGAAGELLTEIPAALAETLEGAERVVTIVRAMKAFGHPGGESKGWADLNEAVRNTLVVATNEIRPGADVVTDFGELPQVWCNLGDINQAVLNLVINAAHAMGEKVAAGGARGTLTVRTRAEPEAVVVDIEDTGVGIPAHIAERVFDQFFTTKDVGVGTGQGLALAHTLVHDHHHGTLTFTSTPGVGTTFTVRLPRKEE